MRKRRITIKFDLCGKNITSLLMRNAPGRWRDDFHQAIKQGRHYERARKSEPERRFRFLTNSYRYVFVFALQRCHWLSPRLPHIILLTAADVTERDGGVWMIARFCDATDYLDLLKKVMTDGEKFEEAVKSVSGAEVEVAKRNELYTFKVLPKRWIVERTFGWLDRCRRLWKNCERLLHSSLQMISLAFIRLLLVRY